MMKEKFYSIERIMREVPDALYYMIIGERSNGKTFSVLEYALKDYLANGNQLAVIRRWEEDLKGKRGQDLFTSAFCENPFKGNYLKTLSKGEYNDFFLYSGKWYLQRKKANGEVEKRDTRPFAFRFALTSGEHDKGTSYTGVKTILFDEFLTNKYYLPEEFKLFMGTVSTIIRTGEDGKENQDVKIFMCGNTVNKYSPYFAEMGLTNINKMKKDVIDVYDYGDSGLRVAVEYSSFPGGKKKSDKYFAFDNPSLKMITSGEWEISVYPHKPVDFFVTDIAFYYFIQFAGETLQCEIVIKDDLTFTFIHRKTTPLKDDSLVYMQDYSPLPNRARLLNRPRSTVEKRIWDYFKRGLVFYQDNEIGDLVRNYLLWCSSQS